ncbi:TPA: archease [archaeon]|jgi:SHS2 domain-containing protein|uniref:Archease n=1 Tax=Candidatus Undinarchaeum marinum TaxID=2756141 RepID=A0A832V432_9ARCH|nr:archease [Candidatus Undinarchaeum marinum]
MKNYEYLEHTADAKFRAFGKTIEEAFSNAALAMFGIITDTEKIQPIVEKTVEVQGNGLPELLYEYLDELLFLLDTDNFILNKMKELKIKKEATGYTLKALAVGDLHMREDTKYLVSGNIKSMTYSEMIVDDRPEKCTVQVVVDI